MPNPPVGDHTSLPDRWIIRRKISGAMQLDDLLSSEFCFGNTERSLFVKAPDGSTLYQFGRINDTLTPNSDSVWSGTYTKNYVDSLEIPEIVPSLKTVLFTAGGLIPSFTGGCSEPAVSDNTGTPYISSDFTSGQSGFWNISIPSDYTGILTKISILYTGPSGNVSWDIKSKILSDDVDIITGGTWSSTFTLSDNPVSSGRLQKIETTSEGLTLFGADSSNAGNFATIMITLASGTGTYKLLQVKCEYY